MIQGFYCILEKKKDGGIYLMPPVVSKEDKKEKLIKKIRFYIPQMMPLLKEEADPEAYPQTPLHSYNSPCGMCDYINLCHRGDLTGLYYSERELRRTPYVSPTEIIRFEICPRQWAYYKVGVKTSAGVATIEAGSAIHKSIEAFLRESKNPVAVFDEVWGAFKDTRLQYNSKDSFESLLKTGQTVLGKFPAFWAQIMSEHKITSYDIEIKGSRSFGDFTLNGVPDLVCRTEDSGKIIFDWKFTAKKYDERWVEMSDQMTGYFLLTEEVAHASDSKS